LANSENNTLALEYAADSMRLHGYGHRGRNFVEFLEIYSEIAGARNKRDVLQLIQNYFKSAGKDDLFSDRILTIKAKVLLQLNEREKARKVLAQIEGDSKELQMLRGLAIENLDERVASMETFLRKYPGDPTVTGILINYHISQTSEDKNHYKKAGRLVDSALEVEPDNLKYSRIKKVLAEPDPNNISGQRSQEIALEVITDIKDPLKRSVQSGNYYESLGKQSRSNGQEEQAGKYFEQAGRFYAEAVKLDDGVEALKKLFNLRLIQKDWPEAQRLMTSIGRKDEYEGQRAEADLSIAREQWTKAVDQLENLLKRRPISPAVHLLLSDTYRKMGQLDKAIDEARLAVSQNRINTSLNIHLVDLLHKKNAKLGFDNLQLEDIREIIAPLQRVLSVRGGNLRANQYYVTYLPLLIRHLRVQANRIGASAEVKDRIGKRVSKLYNTLFQRYAYLIDRQKQNAGNWIMLANHYYDFSMTVGDKSAREKLWQKAESLLKEGIKNNPQSADLLVSYDMFLKKTGFAGQAESEAEKMLRKMIADNTGQVKYNAIIQLAGLCINRDDLDEAEVLLKQAMAQEQSDQRAGTLLARLYTHKKLYDKAADAYDNLRKQSDSDILLARHIEVLLDAGQVESAESLLKQMIEKYPENIRTILLSAKLATRKTKYVEAIAYADKALEKDASNLLAYSVKSNALYYSGRFEEALRCLRELRSLVPSDDNTGRAMLAQINRQLGYHDLAINELQLALSVSPHDMGLRRMLMRILEKLNRWPDIDLYYTKAMERYPEQVDLYIEAAAAAKGRGDWLYKAGKQNDAFEQYKKAATIIRDGLKIKAMTSRQQQKMIAEMIKILQTTGQYDDIVKLTNQELKSSPKNVMLLLYKAEAIYRLGRKEEALSIFNGVVDGLSDQPAYRDNILLNALRIGDDDTILAWCQKRLAEQPDWPAMRLLLSEVYTRQGNTDKAVIELTEGLKTADGNVAFSIENQLAMICMNNGDKTGAIEHFRNLAEMQPENFGLLNNLAYLLMETGQYDQASEIAKKAYELARIDPAIMDTYAMALIEQNQYSKAEEIMRKAIQELQLTDKEVTAEIEYHLAQALVGLDKKEEARQRMNKVLAGLSGDAGSPDDQWKEKIQNLLEKIGN